MICTNANCPNESAVTTVSVDLHKCANEEHLCEKHAKEFMAKYHEKVYSKLPNRYSASELLPFVIELILINSPAISDEHCVYLRHVTGEERFFIIVGMVEAWSLMHSVKPQSTSRPLTHVAFVNTIKCLGNRLQDVILERFDEDSHSYIASLRIQQDDQLVTVDVRPSDAFNLAVVSGAPILIARNLFPQR